VKYYLQDTRSIVGNNVMWWAKDGMGYTYNIKNAQVFSELEAFKQWESRPTDKPWPKDYIDSKVTPIVDCQHIDWDVAMPNVGLRKGEP